MNLTILHRGKRSRRQKLRRYFHRRQRGHDPWLVFNMATFNFEGSWNRIFDPLRAGASGRC